MEPNASVFVYYLYENYNSKQDEFTKKVQRSLEELGDVYSSDVSLLMPNPKYAHKIESEVREIRPLWNKFNQELPGLLISEVPLAQLEEKPGKCYFISLKTKTQTEARDTIRRARSLIDKDLLSVTPIDNDNHFITEMLKKIGKAVELKPNLFGIGIDLNKLFKTNV